MSDAGELRVARASRVLVAASRRNRLEQLSLHLLDCKLPVEKFAKPRRLRQHAGRVRYP